jgi:uncharacterized membrane protein
MFNKLKKMFKKDDAIIRSNRWIFGTMLFFGLVGLTASFILALDELEVIQNPHAVLSCSINIVLNCSTVMQTWQAHVFGFPNMYIGLMAFPVIITVALLGLSGAKLPKWFYVAANIGYLLEITFAYWLFFNSLYAIQVLCPYCLLVTLSSTFLFETISRYNVRENTFGFKGLTKKRIQSFYSKGYDKLVLANWIVVLLLLVYIKFGKALFAA